MNALRTTTSFQPKRGNGTAENHHIIKVPEQGLSFDEQMDIVEASVREIEACEVIQFVRFFMSDAANQMEKMEERFHESDFPTSFIQQAPLDGTKLSAWVYSTEKGKNDLGLRWDAFMTSGEEGSYAQTWDIFSDYDKLLHSNGMTLEKNCLRTWIYVHDVDVNYRGVVEGRKEYFQKVGLTPQTHFIASTGIEGRHREASKFVVMDAVSAPSVKEEQIQHLYAKDHLSPTADYGVTFERGTAVHFEDRTHVYISGTASIDSKGLVLHNGDIARQTGRMLENIAALLAEAHACLKDIHMAVIYLRDIADYNTVKSIISRECPGLNAEFVLAPVCRPAWLVEMECIAIV